MELAVKIKKEVGWLGEGRIRGIKKKIRTGDTYTFLEVKVKTYQKKETDKYSPVDGRNGIQNISY